MPGERLVINEWLLHDLQGDNGLQSQAQSGAFLKRLITAGDRIAVVRGSPWARKAYALMRSGNPIPRILSQLLFLGILLDPAKSTYVDGEQLRPLPPDLAEEVPQSDVYLFQAAIETNSRIIVTTDARLIERAQSASAHGIQLQHRNGFLDQYMNDARI